MHKRLFIFTGHDFATFAFKIYGEDCESEVYSGQWAKFTDAEIDMTPLQLDTYMIERAALKVKTHLMHKHVKEITLNTDSCVAIANAAEIKDKIENVFGKKLLKKLDVNFDVPSNE